MSENGNGHSAVAAPVTPSRVSNTGSPEAFGQVEAPPQAAPPAKRGKKPIVLLVLAVIAVVGIGGGYLWWLEARNYESTDDAFIAADVTQVSPRIGGHVQTVYISDNQFVKAGDKIVDIDP